MTSLSADNQAYIIETFKSNSRYLDGSLPLGAWDGLRYFIVALPEPSI